MFQVPDFDLNFHPGDIAADDACLDADNPAFRGHYCLGDVRKKSAPVGRVELQSSDIPLVLGNRSPGDFDGAFRMGVFEIPAVHPVNGDSSNACRVTDYCIPGNGLAATGEDDLNALRSVNGPCKLVAMADLFEEKLAKSHKILSEEFGVITLKGKVIKDSTQPSGQEFWVMRKL